MGLRRRLKQAGAAALFGVMGLMALGGSIGWWISAPGHTGPVTDHFDGSAFHNLEPTELPSFGRAMRMVREGRGATWEARAYATQPPPPPRVRGTAMRATFVNHSTVLVQHDGMNVLTDPIWSDRCSKVQWLGPQRHHAPGVALSDLPTVDVVLISHNHYDHLDEGTLRALAERDDPVIVVPLGVGAMAKGLGFSQVHELDWEQSTQIGHLTVTGQRVRHFSGRGLFDRNQTLWLGFVVEGDAGRWYFAGDTGDGDHFQATGDAHGPFRLALLPIGAYAPRWFMAPVHIDPVQAVSAHQRLRAERSLGVHHGTFQLTKEPQDEPRELLGTALQEAGLEPWRFLAPRPGEALHLP